MHCCFYRRDDKSTVYEIIWVYMLKQVLIYGVWIDGSDDNTIWQKNMGKCLTDIKRIKDKKNKNKIIAKNGYGNIKQEIQENMEEERQEKECIEMKFKIENKMRIKLNLKTDIEYNSNQIDIMNLIYANYKQNTKNWTMFNKTSFND